jgi:hypothetical protein
MAWILNNRSSYLGTLLESRRESVAAVTKSAGKNLRPSLLIDLYTEHQYVLRLLRLLEDLIQNQTHGSSSDGAGHLNRAKSIMQYFNIDSDPRHPPIEDQMADRLFVHGTMTKRCTQEKHKELCVTSARKAW